MLYVTMTDKALSGWGMAKGKVNKLVLECKDMKEAEIVEQNAKRRPCMIYVNIRETKPYYNSKYYYESFKTIKDYPAWYEVNFGD